MAAAASIPLISAPMVRGAGIHPGESIATHLNGQTLYYHGYGDQQCRDYLEHGSSPGLTSLHVSAVNLPGVFHPAVSVTFTEAGVITAEAFPVYAASLKMPGEDPCSGLNIQADIIQQIFLTPDNAHFFQPGNMCGVNLHYPVIGTDNFSSVIPVMINGPGIQTAFPAGNNFE